MATLLPLLHPSGLPHAEALGIPFWAQWLIAAVVVLVGIWLVLDGREGRAEASGAAPLPERGAGTTEPAPPDWDPNEALVVGRAARRAPAAEPERVLPRAPSMPVSAARGAGARAAPNAGWPVAIERCAVAPGAVRALRVGAGRMIYVEA